MTAKYETIDADVVNRNPELFTEISWRVYDVRDEPGCWCDYDNLPDAKEYLDTLPSGSYILKVVARCQIVQVAD